MLIPSKWALFLFVRRQTRVLTPLSQVTLKRLDSTDNKSEVVHAKFVLGSDGGFRTVLLHGQRK